MEKNFYTLITGASHGIGKAIAIECAKRKMNVALVALDNVELNTTARKIADKYPVNVKYLGIDLTEEKAPKQVYDWSEEQGISVNILINNAGIGTSGLFEQNQLPEYFKIIDLNNRSMVELTYHFYNDIKESGKGYIMNVSSMEATLPLPYKAVYTGTKSFIYAFTLAIREELKGTGVSASVLCPGSVLTNEEGIERIQAHGKKSKLFTRLMITYPHIVARRGIKRMLRGKQVIVPNTTPWLIMKIAKFMPTIIKMKILEKIFRVYR